nr:hypothetical protein [Oceanivirga miroungae]
MSFISGTLPDAYCTYPEIVSYSSEIGIEICNSSSTSSTNLSPCIS